MGPNRFWPVLASILFLATLYAGHSVFRTAQYFRNVAFHELERLSEKLDQFLVAPATGSRSFVVTYDKERQRFQSKTNDGSMPKFDVLLNLRPDQNVAWLRWETTVWRATRIGTVNEFKLEEIPVKAYFQGLALPPTVKVRLLDVYGNPLFSMNYAAGVADSGLDGLDKRIKSPLSSGFLASSLWQGHSFYNVMPTSSTVILATTSYKLVLKQILKDVGIVFSLAALAAGFYAGLLWWSKRRMLRRLAKVPTTVANEPDKMTVAS